MANNAGNEGTDDSSAEKKRALDLYAIEIGAGESTDVENQITRLDNKALGLITGLTLAGVIVGLGKPDLRGVILVLVILTGGCFIASLLAALLTIYPRSRGSRHDMTGSMTGQDLRDQAAHPEIQLTYLSDQIARKRWVLGRKQLWIRWGIKLFVAGIAFGIITVVMAITL